MLCDEEPRAEQGILARRASPRARGTSRRASRVSTSALEPAVLVAERRRARARRSPASSRAPRRVAEERPPARSSAQAEACACQVRGERVGSRSRSQRAARRSGAPRERIEQAVAAHAERVQVTDRLRIVAALAQPREPRGARAIEAAELAQLVECEARRGAAAPHGRAAPRSGRVRVRHAGREDRP